MYVKGNISDLTSIGRYEEEDFINSPLDEIGYFKCDKENLVTLKNYLVELNKRKKDYDRLIADPLKSIQEKNSWCKDVQPAWCKDVQPAAGNIYFMEAKSKNYPSVFIGEYNGNLVDSGIAYGSLDLRGFIYEKRIEKRHKIIENSKDELLEIKKAIQSFGFGNTDEGLVTVSNRFLVTPYSFEGLHIQTNGGKPMDYIIKLNKGGKFTYDYYGLTYFDGNKSKDYADALSKKLYLSKDK